VLSILSTVIAAPLNIPVAFVKLEISEVIHCQLPTYYRYYLKCSLELCASFNMKIPKG
jgi:hypothetical protein